MFNQHLIEEQTLLVEKEALTARTATADGSVLAAIDFGSSLTKVVCIDKNVTHSTVHELRTALFPSKQFSSALAWLRIKLSAVSDESECSPGSFYKIRLTGAGITEDTARKIRAALRLEAEFIDESASLHVGFHFTLLHWPLAEICHPLPEYDASIYARISQGRSGTFKEFRDAQVAMILRQPCGEKFPCLLAFCGSSASIALVREDGSVELRHHHPMAGKSFLGLCQILLGTGDYQSIMDLAARGKRGNIDTQFRDMQGPKGRMPPSLPNFPFGKAVDFDKSLEDCRPEDLADSLVSSFTINFLNMATFVSSFEGVRNVFLCGGFFRHEVARIEALKFGDMFQSAKTINVQFSEDQPLSSSRSPTQPVTHRHRMKL